MIHLKVIRYKYFSCWLLISTHLPVQGSSAVFPRASSSPILGSPISPSCLRKQAVSSYGFTARSWLHKCESCYVSWMVLQSPGTCQVVGGWREENFHSDHLGGDPSGSGSRYLSEIGTHYQKKKACRSSRGEGWKSKTSIFKWSYALMWAEHIQQ